MPTTRSKTKDTRKSLEEINKVELPPEKVYQQITERIDASLKQKVGGCIEAIPAPIYEIIKLYLSMADYRALLDTNLLLFQKIKYETATYLFKGPERWKSIKGFNEKKSKKEYFLEFLKNNIKDKSKQMSMRLYHPTMKDITTNADIFPGLKHLSFSAYWQANFSKFNFDLFNNIYHLTLQNIPLVSAFPAGLQNVVILEIIRWNSLEEVNRLAEVKSLRRLVIIDCFQLKNMTMITNIPELHITQCYLLGNNLDFLKGGSSEDAVCHLKKLHFQKSYLFPANIISKFSNLEELILQADFSSVSLSEWESIRDIPRLFLRENRWNGDILPILPILRSKQVRLEHFNLTKWEGEILENMEMLELEECNVTSLPYMPQVRALNIKKCNKLSTPIPFYENLRKCHLESCSMLENISNLGHIHTLELWDMNLVKEVSKLGRIPNLTIYNLPQLTSLEGLGQGNSFVWICHCSNISDFSPLRNIFRVRLDHVDNFVNGFELTGVSHLYVYGCHNFEDTNHLSHLQSLTIVDCFKLRYLNGVKGIKKLIVERNPNFIDISGLGNHKQLIVSHFPLIITMYKEWEMKGLHDEIFGTVDEFLIDRNWNFVKTYLTHETFITWDI